MGMFRDHSHAALAVAACELKLLHNLEALLWLWSEAIVWICLGVANDPPLIKNEASGKRQFSTFRVVNLRNVFVELAEIEFLQVFRKGVDHAKGFTNLVAFIPENTEFKRSL